MNSKILILKENGEIIGVFSNKDIDIIIVDYDECKLSTLYPDQIVDNMHELFTDMTNPFNAEIKDILKSLK